MKHKTIIACVTVAGFYGLLTGCTNTATVSRTDTSIAGCTKRAAQALIDADFSENLIVGENKVSGRHGEYDAIVYCQAGDPFLHVEIHGLDPDQVDRYTKQVKSKF